MINLQVKRNFGANDVSGDHRVYEIDCGYGRWCDVVVLGQNKIVVDYCFASRRTKVFNNLNDAIQFAINWYSKKFNHLV